MNFLKTLGFFGLLFSFSNSNGQIVINEIMADNASGIEDPDFEKKPDWIEIYNGSLSTIDLSGYFLTDDLDEPMKWQIPTGTTILGNQHLLFWADEKDTGIHTNFKLKKSGEAVGLFNHLGEILDSVIYKNQTTDVSFGRKTDGEMPFTFFDQPTPGASNSGDSFDGVVYFLPDFSKKGGFYDAPIQLELTADAGVIRYTRNGELPTEISPIYSTPITIETSSAIRARVFETDKLPGKTITHSYFFEENFEERKLPVVSIVTDPKLFFDSAVGIYVQNFQPEWEYPINVEFFENDGNNQSVFNEGAGMKMNGNNSWQFPQKILGVYFKNDYGSDGLNYPIFFDRDRNSFDYFALRASGNDQGSTFFRDGLIQEILKGNMDFPLQGFRPASVYVNGEYFGLHNIRSKQNEEYFEYYYDLKRGDYDLILNDGEVDEGDTIAFRQLFDLLDENLADEANYNAVEAVVDMDNLVDYFIAIIWSGNRSWGHNMKMWKAKTPDSKWRFVFKDADRGMYPYDEYPLDYFTETDISPSRYEWARVILRQLFRNSNFQNKFSSRFADHLFSTFHHRRVESLINEFSQAIEAEIPYHLDVWGGQSTSYGDALPSLEYWQNEVGDLKTYPSERQAYLFRNLSDVFGLSETATLAIASQINGGGKIHFNGLKLPEINWSSRYFLNKSIELIAESQVGHQFLGWSFGQFESLIEKSSEWKYLDDGSDLGTAWRESNFDDSAWKLGLAKLGYGEGDEATLLEFGADPDNKFITTYFRKTIEITDLSNYTGQLVFNLMKDDGAVVYLNGKEVFRTVMPAGEIDANTLAYHTTGTVLEKEFTQIIINTELLREGENQIAVEVHQRDESSSDFAFDLELLAVKLTDSPVFSTDEKLNLTLSGNTVAIANFESTAACLLPQIIDKPTVLTKDCSPYHGTGDVKILPGISLTIEAGVEILMPENASLIIEGDLQIRGTVQDSVRISADVGESAGHWGNLRFVNATSDSELNFLVIKNATKGFHPVRDDAAISSYFSNVKIQNSKITEVFGKLISAHQSETTLTNCDFQSSVSGNMVEINGGQGIVEDCDFRGNSQGETTGLRLENTDNSMITDCRFFDFFGKNSHGAESDKCQSLNFSNNLFYNITDKAILLGSGSNANLNSTTIINCKEGISVKEKSFAVANLNTFYNNENAVRAFEKDLGTGGGRIEITNSILSNSSDGAIDADDLSTISVNYSLSDTEELEGGIGNLFTNPLFENPTQNNFELQLSSPCLAAGKMGENLGVDFHPNNPAQPSLLISAINYHPADTSDAEFIEIFNPRNSPISLDGYELKNAIEFTFPQGATLPSGERILVVKDATLFPISQQQIFQWTSGKLDNDGEMIRLEDSHGILVDWVEYDNESPWANVSENGSFLKLTDENTDNHFAENWEAETLVSAKEIQNQSIEFSINPNPTSDNLKIEMPSGKIEKIEIFNSIGQLVFDKKMNSSVTKIVLEVSDFPEGIYFVQLNRSLVKSVLIE